MKTTDLVAACILLSACGTSRLSDETESRSDPQAPIATDVGPNCGNATPDAAESCTPSQPAAAAGDDTLPAESQEGRFTKHHAYAGPEFLGIRWLAGFDLNDAQKIELAPTSDLELDPQSPARLSLIFPEKPVLGEVFDASDIAGQIVHSFRGAPNGWQVVNQPLLGKVTVSSMVPLAKNPEFVSVIIDFDVTLVDTGERLVGRFHADENEASDQ